MFSYGTKFKVTIYGSSHDETMGLVIDGLKPGLNIDRSLIDEALSKRRPSSIGTTKRIELDEYEISNGLFNDLTTGGPIHISVKNTNIKSKDYSNLVNHFRPNHSDFVANEKYDGFNDYRGGGFFSGRITTLLVIAGAIAKMTFNYHISSELIQVGTLTNLDKLDEYLSDLTSKNDSAGGIVKLNVSKMIVGLGDPYFNKLDASLAHILMTIPGVKGVIFGDNFDVSKYGSYNNDLIINSNGTTSTNHSGGIVGGISNGNDIVLNVLVKPTSSIGLPQETFNFSNNKIETLTIEGRHDTAFVRRIPIVLESAIAICLANY